MALVVKSAIRDLVSKKDSRCSGELFDALDKEIEKIILRAQERAKENKRKTIMVCDL